jgi:hypothetical protein
MFCGGSGDDDDMRLLALQARGLLLAPSCAGGDGAAPVAISLLRATAPTEAVPLSFRDVTHALQARRCTVLLHALLRCLRHHLTHQRPAQVALFAEWRCGAPLASMPAASALAAAAAWEEHDAAGRAAVAALLPRWRAAGALFGPD